MSYLAFDVLKPLIKCFYVIPHQPVSTCCNFNLGNVTKKLL